MWFCVYGKEKLPYSLSFELSEIEYENNDEVGIDFLFYNNSRKVIEYFTIIVILEDYQWNQTEETENIKLEIHKDIEPESYYDFSSLIKIFSSSNSVNESIIEYFYISYIQYTDGSVWMDPFGIKKY